MPCRSGLPSGVRGGVQDFPAADAFEAGDGACPKTGACANSRTTTKIARTAVEARERWITGASFLLSIYLVFLRRSPYNNSSANSGHLYSRSRTFLSTRRYSGMLIFQGRENTFE